MKEIWKDIKGFEGVYQVSNEGRVKSLKSTERILKPGLNGGYYSVGLSNGSGKSYFVHRLVALAFIPNPENKPEVNHKKGIKIDNRSSELEWSTHSENMIHAYRELMIAPPKGMKGKYGLSHNRSKPVVQLSKDGVVIDKYVCGSSAERKTGILGNNISKVCNGERKTAGGFIWKFA